MEAIDVLVMTALREEYLAALAAAKAAGITLEERDQGTPTPYVAGRFSGLHGDIWMALAHPTRMGGGATAPLAASLVRSLEPSCIAMCGVCAGNPSDLALGDVVIAELAYAYDEGKRTTTGFEGDHRQVPIDDAWLRVAQAIKPDGLPTFGNADLPERRAWILERLYWGSDPRRHPGFARYLPGDQWKSAAKKLETDELIRREGLNFFITDEGRRVVEDDLAYKTAPPASLPYAIRVGPMASGNVVVKDGVTWDTLKALGVRTVLGLEMEAAAIAQTAYRLGVRHWVVVKGVMDHADPNKNDRFKAFAARSSAEVLFRFLSQVLPGSAGTRLWTRSLPNSDTNAGDSTNIVKDVSGSNITINQNYCGKD